MSATTVSPHHLFNVWSPDSVAECMDGVPKALYAKLWNEIVPMYDGKRRSEWNDDFSSFCLSRPEFWGKLKTSEQLVLNALADKYCEANGLNEEESGA